jgi:helix-turn-helix protein
VYTSDNPLHRARVQQGVGLSQLAAVTLLSPHIIDKIDAGRFAELPGGLYARSYIRAFASVVGLDPEDIVRELAERLPPAESPFPALREIARSGDPAWVVAFNDVALSARKWLSATTVGWTGVTRRMVAATIDALVLLMLQAVLIQVTAWTCGVHPQVLLEFGSGGLAAVWGILVMLYFVILGGIGGKTLGAFISQLPAAEEQTPLQLPTVLGRALLH